MRLAPVVSLLLIAPSLPAQGPAVELPVLLRLGTQPANVPEVVVGRDADAASAASSVAAVPAGARELRLRADKAAPMAAIERVLESARERGVERVFLLATLPDGTNGALALALPEAAGAQAQVTLRAHRERPGVPAESAVPLLRRLQHGGARSTPFVLALAVPADASHAQLVTLLAAAVDADVASVVVRTHGEPPTRGAPAPPGALALDLDASFVVQVPARERVPAATGAHGAVLGATLRAPQAGAAGTGGRFGGVYGGRAGAKPAADAAAKAAALQRAVEWLLRQQRGDGSFADAHGLGDVEGTALFALVLLGRGTTLDGGPDREPLARAIGWLLGQQRDDGRYGDPGPGSLRAHATATWTLSEATGMTGRRELLQGFARAALDWLFAQRRGDGGWNDGTPGASSDGCSTAYAMIAASSGAFFGLEPPAPAAQLVEWFDRHPQREGAPAAAELFARYFAEQSPAGVPRMAMLAETIAAGAPVTEPESCYLATFALFQTGGATWQRWSERVGAELAPLQSGAGADAGSWPAAGGSTAITTTARYGLALSVFYRYSRIVVR